MKPIQGIIKDWTMTTFDEWKEHGPASIRERAFIIIGLEVNSGRRIRTSAVSGLYRIEDVLVVETQNSTYILA